MEPQRPPVPYPATYSRQSQQYYASSPNTSPDEYDYIYNEKDAYERQQSIRTGRGSKSSNARPRDSVISHPFSPKPSSPPSPSSSVSSAGRRHRSTSEIRISSSSPAVNSQNITYPPRAYLDPEKQAYGSSKGRSSRDRVTPGPGPEAVVYDQGEYHEKGPEEKTWQLLFYLSGPCALLSLAVTLWTIFALVISLILAPLRFCSSRPPLSEQLTTFLAPALNLQLHLVYSHNSTTSYSAPMLVVVHLFSPVVAVGVAIAAWTAAAFWIFTSILGDPGGNDGHNDGQESILGVRKWWERWLSRGLRATSD
ncbi:Nn.00g092390.m01.CDS01 [Neocucurbitaria sp. VM-36]